MTYRQIEEAVMSLLEDAAPGVTIKGYAGEFGSDSFVNVALKLPALLVHVVGMTNQRTGNADARMLTIRVYGVDKSLRPDSGRYGAYELMETTRGALHYTTISGVGALQVGQEEMIGYAQGLCVMSADYQLGHQVMLKRN